MTSTSGAADVLAFLESVYKNKKRGKMFVEYIHDKFGRARMVPSYANVMNNAECAVIAALLYHTGLGAEALNVSKHYTKASSLKLGKSVLIKESRTLRSRSYAFTSGNASRQAFRLRLHFVSVTTGSFLFPLSPPLTF